MQPVEFFKRCLSRFLRVKAMPQAGAIFKRDMLGIILLGVTLSFTICKKIGQNLLLSYFLIKKDFFSKKSALVRPLRKYGVTKSIAMTAILFFRVSEKNIYTV